ncbi:MAG: D-alanyl-D-alanine carboxypeptidase [Clostridia bacterium]|nr:D-alanyl-D-alanine carboxypeptidase [Clostridia bacterium]
MKKLLVILVVLIALLLAVIAPMAVFAQQGSAVSLTSKAGLIMDAETGHVIFEHNSTVARPIASMVKIMTLLCIYDNVQSGKISLDDDVSISSNASGMGGSQVFLDANTVHKASQLVKSIIICSANDSCVAMAEHISGSVDNFVRDMNAKARQLNLVNTYFVNCTGLPAVGQFSCAVDVAVMMQQLIKYPNFFSYASVWMEDYVHPDGRITGMTNTNRLSRFYSGCDGGKTGYTSEAMHCLCATAIRGSTRYIAVVIGAPDSKTRFAEVGRLLDYAFANYECKVLLPMGALNMQTEVKGGKSETCPLSASNSLAIFGRKGDTNAEVKFDLPTRISAPIKQGDIVGMAYLMKDGNIIAETEIVATTDIDSKSYFDCVRDIIRSF